MLAHPWFHAVIVLLVACGTLGCQRATPAPVVAQKPEPPTPEPPTSPRVITPIITPPGEPRPLDPPQEPHRIGEPVPRVEPPAIVKAALEQYLKAIDEQEFAAMAEVAEVPFLDHNQQFIRQRSELPAALARMATQLPKQDLKRDIYYNAYATARDKIKDEVTRKLLEEALDDDDWGVTISTDPLTSRTILIRVTDGKAAVVAGPLKSSQIGTPKRIPEPARSLLAEADSFVLYSLEPERSEEKNEGLPTFQHWRVLGQTEIRDAATRERLATAMSQATADNPGVSAFCFKPRHGLRLTRGTQTVDLVICFECFNVEVYVNDQRAPGFHTTFHPQEAFDAAFTAAGIPLAKPSQHGDLE